MVSPRVRRGTAYLLVLVTVMVTVAIGASSVMVHRVRRVRLDRVGDIERARAVAQAGLELATAYIQSDSAWRTNRGLGIWMDGESVLDGVVTLTAVDDDGDAEDDPSDAVTIVSEGVVGSAKQIVSATFQPVPVALDSLSYAVSAEGNVGFEKVINANAGIASNGAMAASSATVNADVYASSTILGLTYTRGKYPSSGTRQHPSTTVFDWYIANGTTINRALLPGGDLRKIVLAPNSNPYGATNPRGIYVINCANNTIKIQDCRIEGTLVLLNVKSDSEISNEVNMKPADPTLPLLLVQGSFTIKTSDKDLSESSEKVNFNPATAPYNGSSDSDQTDVYPRRIEGLIYVSGQLTFDDHIVMVGQAVVGGASIFKADTHTITWNSTYVNNPPQGFMRRYNMLLDVASVARVLDE